MNQVRLNHILLSIMTGKMWIRWMRGMHIVKSSVTISNTTFFVRVGGKEKTTLKEMSELLGKETN